jgi:hypothetical protein
MIGVITSEKSGSFERMGMKLYIIKRLITGSCKPMLFFFYLSSVDINKIPIITNLGTTSLTRTFDENAGVGTPVYDVD